ncbi:MAG: paraquat-inducible protein A [Methylococcaceae bacterium]|nr:paraquat-inducible protein A [Methylococcaceae bacterium]
MSSSELLSCPECGLLQRRVALGRGQVAHCGRCGGELYGVPSGNLDRPLALASAALILFVLANCFPVLGLDVKGRHAEAALLEAALQLRTSGMSLIAGLVLFTTVVIPAMELSGVLYVLAPLKLGVRLPGQLTVYKLIHRLEPWGMIEVFLLGVMVALVKLAHMAVITPGWALWLLGAFVVLSAATSASLHPDEIWSRLADRPQADAGSGPLCRCHDCGWLAPEGDRGLCPRCGSELHRRKPDSIARSWALLIAAALLYIPANLLPVMVTTSLGGTQADTILSGVVYLWVSGSWPLALVVFFASVMVPMLKLVSLVLLLISVQRRWQWRALDRTRLYRITELVGRWSMVDIFVVTMLVALVQLRPLASVDAGPGAVAFGAVVVLTMLAAEAFDPRLIWDALQPSDATLSPEGGRAAMAAQFPHASPAPAGNGVRS